MGTDSVSPGNRFEWSADQHRLEVWLDNGEWAVQHTAPNPLLGPMVVSRARHTHAKQAVWEVMTRVTKATRDDEEGVRVASCAARWIRQYGTPEAGTVYCK